MTRCFYRRPRLKTRLDGQQSASARRQENRRTQVYEWAELKGGRDETLLAAEANEIRAQEIQLATPYICVTPIADEGAQVQQETN